MGTRIAAALAAASLATSLWACTVQLQDQTGVRSGAAPGPSAGTEAVTTPSVAKLPGPGIASDGLIGVSREKLRDLLGPASFVRRDGPTEIWRYAHDECFLDVFLSRGNDSLMVHHVEPRARTRSAQGWVSDRACYSRLIDQRGGSSVPQS
jgi:hypothetical protein